MGFSTKYLAEICTIYDAVALSIDFYEPVLMVSLAQTLLAWINHFRNDYFFSLPTIEELAQNTFSL